MKTEKILAPQAESLSKETVCFKVPAKNIVGKQFLVVPEGWEAVCILDGQLGEVLKRGKYKLLNLKAKSRLFEVLFYPTLSEFSFLWGTKQQMDFSDPIYSLPVKMGANGKLVFLIRNIRNLYLSSKQEQSLSLDEVKQQVVLPLIKFLQEKLADQINNRQLSLLDFEKNKDEIFKTLTADITYFLQNEFGLKLSNFLVDGIIFDKKLFKALEKEKSKLKQQTLKQKEVLEEEQDDQKKKALQNEMIFRNRQENEQKKIKENQQAILEIDRQENQQITLETDKQESQKQEEMLLL